MKVFTSAAALALVVCGLLDTAAGSCRMSCNNCGETIALSGGETDVYTQYASRYDSTCQQAYGSTSSATIEKVEIINTQDDYMTVTGVSSGYTPDKAFNTVDCYHVLTPTTNDRRAVAYYLKCNNGWANCDFNTVVTYSCTSSTASTTQPTATTSPTSTPTTTAPTASATCCYDDHGINNINSAFIKCTDPSDAYGASISTQNNMVVVKLYGTVIPYCATPAPTTTQPTPTTTKPATASPTPTTTAPATAAPTSATPASVRSDSTTMARPMVMLTAVITISAIAVAFMWPGHALA